MRLHEDLELRTREILILQMEVMSRDNASLIYFVLKFFGKLRPRDIQELTGISSGRMYNEIANLIQSELLKKELIRDGNTKKPFYSCETNHLDEIDLVGLDLEDFNSKNPEIANFNKVLLKYALGFPARFQNFVSCVATNAISLNSQFTKSSGDFMLHQDIIKVSNDEYKILRSKFSSLIYDVSKIEKAGDGDPIAFSISFLQIKS